MQTLSISYKNIFKDTKNVNNRSGHFVRRTEKSVNKFVKQINQKPILDKKFINVVVF